MKNIVIKTKRLCLLPLGSAYLHTVNEYAIDRENTVYMCHLPYDSIEETAEFLNKVDLEWEKEFPTFFEFAILYENRHIGAVSLYMENGFGELGWIINKCYWGCGFAYEAAAALVKLFAEEMGISHFMAHCDTKNVASYRVMEKLGMIRTGEYGGRKNRSAACESMEYQYELIL